MDNFQKSISFYNNSKITVSQPLMNHSQSFSFGCGKTGASLKDFSAFKSSLNNIATPDSITKAESSETKSDGPESHFIKMDNLQKSSSFYEKTDLSQLKPLMNHSQSYSYGCNSGLSSKDFSKFKSSINKLGKPDSIREEESSESAGQETLCSSQNDDEQLRSYADQLRGQIITSSRGNEFKFE